MKQILAAGGAKVIQFRGRQVEARFTPRDLLDFELWGSGNCRVEIDRTDNVHHGQLFCPRTQHCHTLDMVSILHQVNLDGEFFLTAHANNAVPARIAKLRAD